MSKIITNLEDLSTEELQAFHDDQDRMMNFIQENFLVGEDDRRHEFYRALREAHTETSEELENRGVDTIKTDDELREKWM